MHVNTVHTAALAKMTKPAVVHPGKILPGKLLFSLSIYTHIACINMSTASAIASSVVCVRMPTYYIHTLRVSTCQQTAAIPHVVYGTLLTHHNQSMLYVS